MRQIFGTNTIFIEDELTPEGTEHFKSLHITVECRGMIISRVLIDNRSAIKCFSCYDIENWGAYDPPEWYDGLRIW